MKLGKKQELFSRLLVQLLSYIHEQGYDVRMGEVWRSKAAAEEYARLGIGIINSAHRNKLAVDINLFLDGKYLTSTEDHRIFGEYWEGLHPLCRWGGRWKVGKKKGGRDGNHYSLEHRGVK